MAYSPWIGNLRAGDVLGNYGTVKLAFDEADPRAQPIALAVQVEIAGAGRDHADFEVELFTNLDRRDHAKIFEPLADADQPGSYWVSHRAQPAGHNFDNLVFGTVLRASKCGAYRLTARYRERGATSWWWHNDFSSGARHRDCAILISPRKAARLSLYEANALTVEAMRGGSYENRSTLDDFLPSHDFDGFNPFQLDYLRKDLGFNALWLMPVFPGTRWRWDRASWTWADNELPGSPYSVRDYFSINPWLADNGEKARAKELFVALVDQASEHGLDVFIDIAFNHAGRDVVFGAGGVELGLCAPDEADAWIREARPKWCTRGTEFRDGRAIPRYREAADNGFACAIWAPGDRLNEHIWDDANVDWYFGDYSALGPKYSHGATDYFGNPVWSWDPRGSAEDERDLYYTDLSADADTAAVWAWFAHILPFWIRATNGKLAGVRADFAQGLPNQLWEFMINKTRQARWDFVFLAEVLDPDPVQYRLNKVFDVLTTLDHYLYRKTDVRTGELVGSLEREARIFGGEALLMHNGTSHDESGNPDRWAMVARYAVAASVHGVPMIFMGQPLGVANKLPFREQWSSMYEAWSAGDAERARVAEMYRRINAARERSAELRAASRYFLELASSGFHGEIFAVAKWISRGALDSVVLVFINLNAAGPNTGTFRLPRAIRLAGAYQARNLVADDPNAVLWPAAKSAAELSASGIFVRLSMPNEVQYLELIPA